MRQLRFAWDLLDCRKSRVSASRRVVGGVTYYCDKCTASMLCPMNRRHLGHFALAAIAGAHLPAHAQSAPLLADMHSHLGIFSRSSAYDLTQVMRDTGVTLLAWSVVDDAGWMLRDEDG